MSETAVTRGVPARTFRLGIVLFGPVPLILGVAVKLLRPEWKAGSPWDTYVSLFLIVTVGAMAVTSLLWSVASRYHGLITMGALCLFCYWVVLLAFETAKGLMDISPNISVLPDPAGLVAAIMLGAWARVSAVYCPDCDRKRIRRAWLGTAAALVPATLVPAALFLFIRPLNPGLMAYGLTLILIQAAAVVLLVNRVPRRLLFLPCVAAAGLVADALSLLLLTPARQFLPDAGGTLIRALGAWILLYGIGQSAETAS